MKQLLMTVAACALLTTGAQAYELTCNAPRVLLGADPKDFNPVVSVDLRYVPEDHSWRIFHNMRDGKVVSRSEQYAIQDASTDDMAQWQGSLNRQRNLYMVGEVNRGDDGGIYYHEWMYDRNKNQLVMQSKALCRPASQAPLVMQTDPLPVPQRMPMPQQRQQVAAVMRFMVPFDVSNGKMNVRGGPGANHALLGAIPAGQHVTASQCVARDDGIAGADWCLVTWGNLTGWVSRVGLMPTS